jgi:hypothetical protein
MAPSAPRDVLRPLRLPGYSFLAMTILLQTADFFIAIAPYRPEAVMWRFSALGQASGSIGNILLLVLLLYVFALLLQDTPALATVSAVTGLLALILFLAAAAFALDALQLRSRVESQIVRRFDIAAAEAMFKFVVQGVISGLMSLSALRSWRISKRTALRTERTSEEMLVMRNTPAVSRPAQD